MKLLNIDANAKTVKGQARGYMTAVLYLSPWKSAGVNLCPTAELAGCNVSCLNTAGRGGIAAKRATFAPYGVTLPDNAIQHARIARTRLFVEDRQAFMVQLEKEITAFVERAWRKRLTPCVRLNGTSDILWEREIFYSHRHGHAMANMMARFPAVQFYDYTKLPGRLGNVPPNYYLCVSYSGRHRRYVSACVGAQSDGASLVYVVRDATVKAQYLAAGCIDGDANDLRFLDPSGSCVVLKAKGLARKDQSGFVLDFVPDHLERFACN